MITIEELKILCEKLYFDMNDEEYLTLQKEFEVILKQMELLGDIDGLNEVEPLVFPVELTVNSLRDDEPGDTLEVKEVLVNAKESLMDMIKVKKVIG